jgi:hypothetical protein
MALDWAVSPDTPEDKAPNKLIFFLLQFAACFAAASWFHSWAKYFCH